MLFCGVGQMSENFNIRLLDYNELHLVEELAESTNSLMRNKNYKEFKAKNNAA
jgi:hypothetical protein